MSDFGLFLFATEPWVVRAAAESGVDGFVVDWEQRGKRDRQAGRDTEVNADTVEDLARVRAVTTAPVLCRVNGFGPGTPDEVEAAISGGADEILLPMVTGPDEVQAVIEAVSGRCGVGILVETVAAVDAVHKLALLPLSRVYVGLNDLSIERGTASLFEAIADGTVERVVSAFDSPFGFGGLTEPDLGAPVPCRLLIAEMTRLRSSFSFLRRSYRRDVPVESQGPAIDRIRSALGRAARRGPERVAADSAELRESIGPLVAG